MGIIMGRQFCLMDVEMANTQPLYETWTRESVKRLRGDMPARALALARQAAAADPARPEAHFLMARALRVLGRKEEARDEARLAAEKSPDGMRRAAEGLELSMAGDAPAALARWRAGAAAGDDISTKASGCSSPSRRVACPSGTRAPLPETSVTPSSAASPTRSPFAPTQRVVHARRSIGSASCQCVTKRLPSIAAT